MKETNFANYADENTHYVTAENIDNVMKSLKEDSIKLFQCFSDKQIKTNHYKYRLLLRGKIWVTNNINGFKKLNTKWAKFKKGRVQTEV